MEKCFFCLSPLELGDRDYTCERCWQWRRNKSKCSALLTEDELRELEDYSRFIHTRPRTPQELEIEEIARAATASRRSQCQAAP